MQLLITNTTIAVVARCFDGNIVKAQAKGIPPCVPIVAQTSAILWAPQLALEENDQNVLIEADSKL